MNEYEYRKGHEKELLQILEGNSIALAEKKVTTVKEDFSQVRIVIVSESNQFIGKPNLLNRSLMHEFKHTLEETNHTYEGITNELSYLGVMAVTAAQCDNVSS